MALNLSFLPLAVAGVIQDGVLDRRIEKSIRPALNWRTLCQKEKVPQGQGEKVTKTRSGLIPPSTKASARLQPGQEPGLLSRSIEQYTYQVAPYGKSLVTDLPAGYFAAEKLFLDDMDALGFHAAQTIGRIARDSILEAYEGGDTFTTDDPGSVTSVAVKECKGFGTVMVNGVPTAVSVANPLPVTIGGTARNVTAVSASEGPGTLTISVALDYAQYDRVLRTDAPRVVRQNSRATDRLIVAGDVPTIATFRRAAAIMRANNVPGLDGTTKGLYPVFIGPYVQDSLFADSEFHDAIQSQGLTGAFADGALGDYGGMRFIPQPQTEMPVLADDGDYQTDIHRSFMFGLDTIVEAFVPETDFAAMAEPAAVASMNHYKMPLDGDAALSLVIRAPMDALGRRVTSSWAANVDYCIPTDIGNLTGAARHKRACVIKTAGPAV